MEAITARSIARLTTAPKALDATGANSSDREWRLKSAYGGSGQCASPSRFAGMPAMSLPRVTKRSETGEHKFVVALAYLSGIAVFCVAVRFLAPVRNEHGGRVNPSQD